MGEELFTRGAPGDADTRGESLVNRHLAASRAAAEAAAQAALAARLPEVAEPLLAAALDACGWDVSAAERYVCEFAAATGKTLGERRKKSRSASSDSDSKRKRRRRDHHDKTKKEKKEKRGEKRGAIQSSQYGRFGLVKESDLHEKQPEFVAWLLEVQKRSPDGLAKWEERELFKAFMEDYNTATMPSSKYYNLAHWEKKAAARRNGPAVAVEVDVRGDEAARRAEVAAERERAKQAGGSALIDHMRLIGKLDGLKEQIELQTALRVAAQVGDAETVRQLQAKLAPDDPRKSAAALNYGFRPS